MSAAPAVAVIEAPWSDPVAAAAGLSDRAALAALVSDGGGQGRWSFVAAEPDLVLTLEEDAAPFEALRAPEWQGAMVVGLASYDGGAWRATGRRAAAWPDLILARFPALLRFDHQARAVRAEGRGPDASAAKAAAERALAWLGGAISEPPPAPAAGFTAERPAEAYLETVEDVRRRIAAGELFQANVARAWGGLLKPAAAPFDVFLRLQTVGAAPYGAYWRVGERALASNSPELFLAYDAATGRIETRPIKGTRPRRSEPASDAAMAEALLASAKDRAENLMIVDLMRNDLARSAEPGSVQVEALFALESHRSVHHLVSTVTARARSGSGAAEVLQAAFPPGSITGAPKHQAMKVIAAHEPPRGPWCGSLFLLDADGSLSASVLIRTASFQRAARRWRFRTLAGAGIVADSEPQAELAETEAKISAIREALTGQPS